MAYYISDTGLYGNNTGLTESSLLETLYEI
jgi:hypothetical protein